MSAATLAAGTLELEITAVTDATPRIRTFTLAHPDRRPLPSFVPGSHLVLECGSAVNAYSLVGECTLPEAYVISVLRVDDGQGGSQWLHRRRPGHMVTARPPRSLFAPMQRARKHLLIAGGIGITPILSHLRSAARWGQEAEILYAHKEGHGAHLKELEELAAGSASITLRRFTGRAEFLTDLDDALGRQPLGAHLYCCGPDAFMGTVCAAAEEHGWPAGRVHTERFGADALDPGEPFEVELTESGQTVEVPSGTSLLEVLEARGISVPNLCRQGFCGECRIPVTRGVPLHRDHYLEDDEKEADDSMMCCVSRAQSSPLEVPL